MSSTDSSITGGPSHRPLPLGTVIRDTYTVDEQLGCGRFGAVYLVRHRYLGMQAMKVFGDDWSADGSADRFNEAFLLSRVSHPNVVRMFDANILSPDDPREYMTMEYVEGGSLDDWLRSLTDRAPSIRRVLDLMCQAAAGLAHAHSQDPPIIHRDIKPANLLVYETGGRMQTKVGDFGLACGIDPVTRATGAGGTILYMAPESFKGYEVPASDVYSLGLVMYQLLTGRFAFDLSDLRDDQGPEHISRTVEHAQRQRLEVPSTWNADVAPDLDKIVIRALATDPGERYRDAVELFSALNAFRTHTSGRPYRGDHTGDRPRTSDKDRAKRLVTQANELAERASTITGAAELMDEAFLLDPSLERQYRSRVEEWRRGRGFTVS